MLTYNGNDKILLENLINPYNELRKNLAINQDKILIEKSEEHLSSIIIYASNFSKEWFLESRSTILQEIELITKLKKDKNLELTNFLLEQKNTLSANRGELTSIKRDFETALIETDEDNSNLKKVKAAASHTTGFFINPVTKSTLMMNNESEKEAQKSIIYTDEYLKLLDKIEKISQQMSKNFLESEENVNILALQGQGSNQSENELIEICKSYCIAQFNKEKKDLSLNEKLNETEESLLNLCKRD